MCLIVHGWRAFHWDKAERCQSCYGNVHWSKARFLLKRIRSKQPRTSQVTFTVDHIPRFGTVTYRRISLWGCLNLSVRVSVIQNLRLGCLACFMYHISSPCITGRQWICFQFSALCRARWERLARTYGTSLHIRMTSQRMLRKNLTWISAWRNLTR